MKVLVIPEDSRLDQYILKPVVVRIFADLDKSPRIEVWLLAIHHKDLGAPWREIREEVNPKERFALPFLNARAPRLDLGQGRTWAMRELGGQWRGVLRGVLDRCPEIRDLKRRLEVWLDEPR